MTLEVKVNDPNIQYQSRESQDKMHIWCKLCDSSSNPLQVNAWTSKISKNSESKWPWRSRTSIFNTNQKYSMVHVWWFQPKAVLSFCADKSNLWEFCEELLCGQAKFPRILSQHGQNDLDGQGQRRLFSIPAESIPGCMFDCSNPTMHHS